jgi:adenylate cyclase
VVYCGESIRGPGCGSTARTTRYGDESPGADLATYHGAVREADYHELAAAVGTTPEMIERFVETGLLPGIDDGQAASAIARTRLLLGFLAGGIELETLAEGSRSGTLDLDFVGELMPTSATVTEETHAALAKRLDLPAATVTALRSLLGTVEAADEDHVRADDVAIFEIIAGARALGASDDQLVDVARVAATAVRTMVRAYREFVDEVLIEPELAAGSSIGATLSRTSRMRHEYRRLGAKLAMALMARYTDEAIFGNLVVMGERALAEADIFPARPGGDPCIGFVDISGYTRMADAYGDEEAARVARGFARLVDESASAHGGQVVKSLGDGAMVVFDSVDRSLDWATSLLGRSEREGLPTLHIGLNAGPVVRRDGDYFGGVVNVAARVAAQAGPGEILVTAAIRDAIGDEGTARFEEIGLTRLRNVAQPLPLYRVIRAV